MEWRDVIHEKHIAVTDMNLQKLIPKEYMKKIVNLGADVRPVGKILLLNITISCPTKEFAKKFTSAQTNQPIEPYPGGNDPTSQIVIDSIYVGGDAAGQLQLLDDTGAVIPGYFFAFAAGVPIALSRLFYNSCPKGRGLSFTTTNGGNHAIVLKYHIDVANIQE